MKNGAEIQILCRNIAALRKKRAMTQRDMADLMGISVSTLRKLEKGFLPPRLKMDAIFALVDAFSLPLAALFRETAPSPPRLEGGG